MKSIFKSKTAAVALLTGLIGFYPPVKEFVSENPESVLLGIGILNLVLRAVTKEKVVLFPNGD